MIDFGKTDSTQLQTILPEQFANERRRDLQTFVEGATPRLTGLRTFQTLPRHLRRRSMSHNLHRVPARLRERAAREMTDVRDPKQNKPKRRFRRRPPHLAADHERRQQTKRWLSTHVWHAKRMRMQEQWGIMLAQVPNTKCIRSLYRAETQMCTVHDASYCEPIEIRGSQVLLFFVFRFFDLFSFVFLYFCVK